MTATILERFPEELRTFIFDYCDSSTILNLCLTSKALLRVCISSLYRNIDLSAHNRETWQPHDTYSNVKVPADYANRSFTEQDGSLLWRQQGLAGLLARYPELATQCRTLRWTRLRPGPDETLCDSIVCATDGLWHTFKCFTRLTTLDLAFTNTWRETDAPPQYLFSTVTSLSIGGILSHAVATSIFGAVEPTKLRYLALNNVQTFADTRDVLEATSDKNKIRLHRRDRPGPLQGYLQPFIGKCPQIRTFHYLTTASFVDESTTNHPRSTWPLEVADEHSRYAELGAFIASIKPHLQELWFEHGPDINFWTFNPGRHTVPAFMGPSHDAPLPMDTYFDTHLFPVLACGPWPKLSKLIVRGIGHWKPIHPWDANATPEDIRYLHSKTRAFHYKAEMIWDAVDGANIDVCIEDTASRPFYRYQSDDKSGNGTGAHPPHGMFR